MTTPKPTDQAVSALPIHDGRVELLEEIMASPVIDRTIRSDPGGPRHSRRWVGSIAAAAAIITVAAVPLYLTREGGDPSGSNGAPGATVVESPSGERAILTTDGWTVDNVNDDEKWGGEIGYDKGDQHLAITWYPADQYDSYVTDREHIDHPEVNPGEAIEVLGAPARLWAYTSQDHTVIRTAGDKWFLEVRGDGMGKQAFVALLGDLQRVDKVGLESALPADYVTREERPAAIADILDGIGTLPPGLEASDVTSSEPDRYHLGADVAGTVACAWFKEYAAAKSAGNESRMAAAAAALEASHDWPILHEMDARGDYPEVLWEYTDMVAAGNVPEGHRQGRGLLVGLDRDRLVRALPEHRVDVVARGLEDVHLGSRLLAEVPPMDQDLVEQLGGLELSPCLGRHHAR